MNNKELVTYLVNELFKCGSEPTTTGGRQQPWRIAFKLGEFQNETEGGGFAKQPLINFLTESLDRLKQE